MENMRTTCAAPQDNKEVDAQPMGIATKTQVTMDEVETDVIEGSDQAAFGGDAGVDAESVEEAVVMINPDVSSMESRG